MTVNRRSSSFDSADADAPSILEQPSIAFGREICGDLTAAFRREWLVTNGLGGYASATLAGIPTRSYHGLLVAALTPPVARTVLVAAMDEWVNYAGTRYPLSTFEFGGDSIAPAGYRHLESFRLEGTLPVWTYAIADALIERRVWMEYGSNTTFVRYRMLRGSGPLDVEATPLLTWRSFHALTSGNGQAVSLESDEHAVAVRFGESAPFWLASDRASFEPSGSWWWGFHFREETARGLGDRGDLYAPGTFRVTVRVGESVTVVASTGQLAEITSDLSLESALDRQRTLLSNAAVQQSSPMVQQLVLAADQFIVAREVPGDVRGESVIAGYHWFNDWGRDTMIALPGLCLSTGRAAEAERILRTFAQYVDRGLLPNNFPDQAGVIPGYNTADATLWYVLAIHRYVEQTGDQTLAIDLFPTLEEIVRNHLEGTRYHIGVDPEDGLLHAGEAHVQLTWMDAMVGDWVVTPRIGKPVEINALWYNVLRIMSQLASSTQLARGDIDYAAQAARVRQSFSTRFCHAEMSHLADVVDGPDGDDWSIRPNQIFAVSLPFPLIEGDVARRVLSAAGQHLLTSYGLRSLAPSDPAYRAEYRGNQLARDGAYHQGTVWSWLLGPYAEAMFRIDGDSVSALNILRPMSDHLRDAGLGTISEIFEAGAPHLPRGCIAQAWGVAETLRVLRLLEASAG